MPALKFVVISTKSTYEQYSEEIVSKISKVKNCKSEIDTNYGESLSSRINRYKKLGYNIATIGLSEVEHNTILIHLIGSRPKTMELDEFIELLESYDGNEEDDEDDESSTSTSSSSDEEVVFSKEKTKKEKNDEKNKNEEDDVCIIM